MSTCGKSLYITARRIGQFQTVTLKDDSGEDLEQSGPLSIMQIIVRNDLIPTTSHAQLPLSDASPDSRLCNGYTSGDVVAGDTACKIKNNTLTFAVRDKPNSDNEWQLVRWCVIDGVDDDDEGCTALPTFCVPRVGQEGTIYSGALQILVQSTLLPPYRFKPSSTLRSRSNQQRLATSFYPRQDRWPETKGTKAYSMPLLLRR